MVPTPSLDTKSVPVPDSPAPVRLSRMERAHPVVWAALVGIELLLTLGLGLLSGLAGVGGGPVTAQNAGYIFGAMLAPFLMAGIGVGIYYAIRKTRRTWRREIPAVVGWALLLTLVALPGELQRSPRWPADKQEQARLTLQAYKEASGAVPPEQFSKGDVQAIMRDAFRDAIQFRLQYQKAIAQFQTSEMKNLYGASSFRDRRTIQETVRQLRDMATVEQQYSSLDPIFRNTQLRIQEKNWPEQSKRDFLQGMQNTLVQNSRSRLAVLDTEKKWIDASIDLYTFALSQLPAISVRQNQVTIRDAATRTTFNDKLHDAVALRRKVVEASKQYTREQAANASKAGLNPSDLGLK